MATDLLTMIDEVLNEDRKAIKDMNDTARENIDSGDPEKVLLGKTQKAQAKAYKHIVDHYTMLLQKCKGEISTNRQTLALQQQQIQTQRNEILRLGKKDSGIVIPGEVKH